MINFIVGITGAGAGIGKGIAKQFAIKGYKVILIDRNEKGLEQAYKELIETNSKADIVKISTDLSTEQGRAYLYEKVPYLDVLVNNVGYYVNIPFFELTEQDWTKMIQLNFMIGMHLSQYYLESMLKNNYGRIIFVSSESAINPDPEKIHYCVAKIMVSGLARNLAELTKDTKVTVNAILPGPALTEGTKHFIAQRYSSNLKEAEKQFMESRPTSIINRLITPDEIGKTVVFLADKESGAINGSNLRVEGGIINSVF